MKRLIKKAVQTYPNNLMRNNERLQYFEEQEYGKDDVQKMEDLFNMLGQGGEAQATAKEVLVDEIRNQTSLGNILLSQIELATSTYENWYQQYQSYVEQEIETKLQDFDPAYNYYGVDDIETFERYLRNDLEKSAYLYRKGDHGDVIESWTSNDEGADMGDGPIGFDLQMKFTDLKNEGYKILGGTVNMMGAPGEGEITLINMNKI